MDYYDEACSFGALYKALKKCCRNVRWKDSVVGYEANGLVNTLKLRESILNGKYKISPYQEFTVHEPKERKILAARIVDRQFQRSLCESGLYRDITEHLIRDNVACQTGRGVDDALRRMRVHLMRYYRQHGADGKVLMLMDSAKVTKQRRRIRKLWAREQAGTVPAGSTKESVRAFLANAKRGDTWKIQQAMKAYYTEVTGGVIDD